MSVSEILDIDAFVASSGRAKASWVQVAAEHERPVISPAFILGNWPEQLSYGYYSETKIGPIRCYRLRNIRLTLDGVMIAGERALATSLVNHPHYHVGDIVHRLASRNSQLPVRRVDGQFVMLSGPGHHIYGHWLIDILPRLFVLASCGYDIATLRYAVPSGLQEFCYEYLGMMGICRSQLLSYDEATEMLEVEELLVPGNLRAGSQIHPMMRQAISFIRERLPLSTKSLFRSGRRLFISRRGSDPSRTLINRTEIEDIVTQADYEVVSPETMTILEQVSLFSTASEIVGEYGSGLHGSVFAPPGTVIMALRGASHHPGFIQSGLGNVLRQPTGYVLSPTPIDAVDQAFEVSADVLRLGLRCVSVHAAQAGV